jgi:hypothetical protein
VAFLSVTTVGLKFKRLSIVSQMFFVAGQYIVFDRYFLPVSHWSLPHATWDDKCLRHSVFGDVIHHRQRFLRLNTPRRIHNFWLTPSYLASSSCSNLDFGLHPYRVHVIFFPIICAAWKTMQSSSPTSDELDAV